MLHRLSFDLWYLFRPPWDTGVSPPELLEYLGAHPPARALDLGCGTGTNVVTLARHGWTVTGIDFSALAIGKARRKAHNAGVQVNLLRADLSMPVEMHGKYELALDMGCLHSLATRRHYLANLTAWLSGGGSWLLYAFHRAESSQALPGIDSGDLETIRNAGFRLLERTDGFSRSGRPSAWFLFTRENPSHLRPERRPDD
jgi:cyclopropane fatty-acyl-phospholipid synthase-like methyltransferase